jgi:hypothetical protein
MPCAFPTPQDDIDAALAAVFSAPRGLDNADAAVIPELLREVERGQTPESLASYVCAPVRITVVRSIVPAMIDPDTEADRWRSAGKIVTVEPHGPGGHRIVERRELPALGEIVRRPLLMLAIDEGFRRSWDLGFDISTRLRTGRSRFIKALLSREAPGEPAASGEAVAKSEDGLPDSSADAGPLAVFMAELVGGTDGRS